jgi:hypothetical protein
MCLEDMSRSQLFIIESLRDEKQKKEKAEGRILSKILAMSGKECKYRYVHSKEGLKQALEEFTESGYRYLHLSCHGSKGKIHTTCDDLTFREFAVIVKPHLKRRRLFLSACLATNKGLAKELMPRSGCWSIMGPTGRIHFNVAVVLWASFYHLMFRADSEKMSYEAIKATAKKVVQMFEEPMTLIRHAESSTEGYQLRHLKAVK